MLLLLAGDQVAEADRACVQAAVVAQLKEQLSPRHVPDGIVWVRRLPRTLTGKKLEMPVKQLLLGADRATVASAGSLTMPAALDELADWAQRFRADR